MKYFWLITAMSGSRVTVRRLLKDNFERSGEQQQNLFIQNRVDASDDYLPLTTFLHPRDATVPYVVVNNENREVLAYCYDYSDLEVDAQSGFSLLTALPNNGRRKQCVMFTTRFKYEPVLGQVPDENSILAAAETFFPGRTTVRRALRTGRLTDIRLRRQIFLFDNASVAFINEIFNDVFDVRHEDITLHLSFYSCLVYRAVKYFRYTISVLIMKSFIAGDTQMKKEILYSMYANECAFCGLVRKGILFHDISISEDETVYIASVNTQCRAGNSTEFFDFNARSCFTSHAAWVSLHIIVVYSGPSTPIPWNSHFGYVSLITTFLRVIRANLGVPVTSNSLARAYISMLKGYLREREGCIAAENAFVRGLYALEGIYFDF
ncbi:unnamed protein product [Arctia plantaginis]|uniref:Uncharacterized protein n=1 Tax=Arctia plantaginis TaxID=874455 RepID=A0A8S1A1G1_ARCPL|nr:unnamed protein product [Arctia plantaginis]